MKNVDDLVKKRIQEYLAEAKDNLNGMPGDEQDDILHNIETHIYSALADNYGESPTVQDAETVISEMASPSSYNNITATSGSSRGARFLATVVLIGAICVIAGLIINGSSEEEAEVMEVISSETTESSVTEEPAINETVKTTEATPTEDPVNAESDPIVPPPPPGKVVVALNPLSSITGLDIERSAVSDIMQAEMSQSESITLVDRDHLYKTLNELKLSQQGMVEPESARQIGKIVGCRYFCSGHLRESGGKLMATVKIIDIETTLIKLAYTFLESKDDSVEAGKTLAKQVEDVIAKFEKEKAARPQPVVKKAKPIPASWKRPIVLVVIKEMHVRRPQLIDPAGEIEITKRLLEANFRVVDSEYVQMMKSAQQNAVLEERTRLKFGEIVKTKSAIKNLKTASQYAAKRGAEVLLYGEAVSERAASLGDFEGCRARIELKAIKVGTDEILLADSDHGGATDLAETVAGKKAIQQATNRLADTFLYKLAEKWNK